MTTAMAAVVARAVAEDRAVEVGVAGLVGMLVIIGTVLLAKKAGLSARTIVFA